jgi:hypothetical protein
MNAFYKFWHELRDIPQWRYDRFCAACFASLLAGLCWLVMWACGKGNSFIDGAVVTFWWLEAFNSCGGRSPH